jgi:hypothetical protein
MDVHPQAQVLDFDFLEHKTPKKPKMKQAWEGSERPFPMFRRDGSTPRPSLRFQAKACRKMFFYNHLNIDGVPGRESGWMGLFDRRGANRVIKAFLPP